MDSLRSLWILFWTCFTITNAANDNPILPACQATDFKFVYTECDSEGGRWRVAVPQESGTCVGGAPPPPIRGKGCSFTCTAGEYINIQSDQECHPCPSGSYSLGGGVRFEDWDHLPAGFSVETEEFTDMFSSYRDYGSHSKASQGQRNCSSAGWRPNGDFISSVASDCATSLVFSANLVKAGYVKFTYQYTDSTFFQFLVQNDQCQTVGDKNTKYPQQTEQGEWNTVKVNLKSGLNLLHWRTLGMAYSATHLKHPVLIKSIEVSGVAYTSECTKCMNGTFSQEGSAYCEQCGPNTYSRRGASSCTTCDEDSSYSDAGAAFCLVKKACTDDDYIELSSGCQTNQTQRHYEWITPKICRDDIQGAVTLPPPSDWEACPPCNPGMDYVNGACEFCPNNQYGSGDGPCEECSASTAPVYGLHLKWWKNIPVKANITTSCLSLSSRGCNSPTGWMTDNSFIFSGRGHADDSYLVLTLKLGGFRGTEQLLNGKPVPVATISFYFELECTARCTLFFMQNTANANTAIVETWEGTQTKQLYTMDIYKTESVEFNWAFQKRGIDEYDTQTDLSRTYEMINDIAKIYEIVVTNTLDGGASQCKSCPKGANVKGCIPCPAGEYISTNNTSRCIPCPANAVVNRDNAWGQEACITCGEGLVRSADKTSCVTNCKYTRPAGQEFDFHGLSGAQTTEGVRLFTASGTQYYHHFNFSLCANSMEEFALCKDNISYGIGQLSTSTNSTVTDTSEVITPVPNGDEEREEHVAAMICRTTMIPPSSADEDLMAAQPVSLGDILVNITSDPGHPYHKKLAAQLTEQGFPMDDRDMDVHFLYLSQQPTSACRDGRTTIVTLRCDMAQPSDIGTIDLPPKCPDGTCDGCDFHFLWRTPKACPICKEQDYSVVVGVCEEGLQAVHYIPPKHCVLQSGNEPYTKTRPCTILPFWLEIAIGAIIGCGLLLLVLVIYCWKKNKKLEYKYSKLATPKNGREDEELPAAPSCGLDEDDDEDEQFDSVDFSHSNKGNKFFNKLKNMGKKEGKEYEPDMLPLSDAL